MARYLVQASYSQQGISDMIKNPHDRAASVRPVLERMGGSVEAFYFALGDFDIVAIFDVPDNVSATALAMAIGASGGLKDYKTTVLIPMDEAAEAMRKAGTIGYQPPGG
jgi:uncharacterized protein with GYD domain